jgi:predicted dehydrogenase
MKRRNFLKSAILVGSAPLLAPVPSQESISRSRVAVIGHTGRGNYGHGLDTMWLHMPECEIVAVADPDVQGLKSAEQRLGGTKGYLDYQEMLRVVRPDVVSIAPRHIDQHLEMVVAAVESGVKGVYLEKPFCRNLKEADKIIQSIDAKGVKLALAHRNRYHPSLEVARAMVEAGELGPLLEVRARGKEDHRGGVQDLWVLGSHLLNLIPLFTGHYANCSASLWTGSRKVEQRDLSQGDEGVGLVGGDRLHARFMTEKDVVVYFDSIRGVGTAEGNFGFQVLGTKGVLDIRVDIEPLVHFLPGNPFYPNSSREEWLPVTSAGVGVPEPIPTIVSDIAGHLSPARDLIDAIRSGRQPLCDALEGRVTIEAIMAIFESHRLGGATVDFPLVTSHNPLDALL